MAANDGDYISIGTLPYYEMDVGKGIWPEGHLTLGSSYNTVTERFDQSMEIAQSMLERLVGSDGESGYLGSLASLLEAAGPTDIDPLELSISDFVQNDYGTPADPGAMDALESIPSFDVTLGSLEDLPAIDTSELVPGTPPAEVNATIDWTEIVYSSDIYTDLLARVLADLTAGATGLDATVEAEIWSRGQDRQLDINDKAYSEIEDYFSSRGLTLPSGIMAAQLAEATYESARNSTELNEKISISQAELAQNNSQFIITQSVILEQMLRDFTSKNSDRELAYEKAVADLILANYSEKVKAFVAVAEGQRIYVEAQVAVLRGVIEYNKGLIASYTGQVEAYSAYVNALASANKATVDSYLGEIQVFDVKNRVKIALIASDIEIYKTEIDKADLDLREYIARIDGNVKGYVAEMGTKEEVVSSMAGIASQAVASALTSVNASASYGYNASESRGESWGHNESRSEALSVQGSLSETHNYEEEA